MDRLLSEDELIRRLGQEGGSPNRESDSTLAGFLAELDTLADELKRPVSPDDFLSEPELAAVVSQIENLASSPAAVTGDERAAEEGAPRPEPVLLGQYRLLSELGSGGMGTVYQAQHVRLQNLVAVKVLPPGRIHSQQMLDRFDREMRAAGKLQHPHVVRALDAGDVDGTHYLVMEFVDGCDLAALGTRVGPLRISDACELIRQAAIGLQHIADHGLVHRDIKPSNLMLARSQDANAQPTVKILDLGLALFQETQFGSVKELTATGQVIGTINYMAPEQGLETPNQLDIRADLYSLGATLYRLLSGRAPFENEKNNTTFKRLRALEREIPQPLSDLRPDCPPELSALVAKLLAKSPAERPSKPIDVAQSLRSFAQDADLAALLNRAEPSRENSAAEKVSATWSPLFTSSTVAVQSAAAETPTEVRPQRIEPPPRGPRFRRASLFAGLVAVAALFAVIVIQSDQGTLEIEAPDDLVESVHVSILKDGAPYENDFLIQPGRTEHRIRSGRVEVRLPMELADHFELLPGDQLVLRRNQRATVKLRRRAGPQENELAPSDSARVARTPIDEPPPLEEWIKGRTILTVAQDGSGQFQTIQAALDALKAGQAVRILDKGPYREQLNLSFPPSETGLISDVNSVIELPRWMERPAALQMKSGHVISGIDGFRLSGCEFRFPPVDALSIGIEVGHSGSGLTIEHCLIDLPNPGLYGAALGIGNTAVRRIKPIIIRECLIRGHVGIASDNETTSAGVVRNIFEGSEDAASLAVGGRFARFLVFQNVFLDRYKKGADLFISPATGLRNIEFVNNTSLSWQPNHVGSAILSKGRFLNQGNLRIHPGTFAFVEPSDKILSTPELEWFSGYNAYPRPLRHLEQGIATECSLPPSPTDVVGEMKGLNLEASDRDFLRVPVESPLANGGPGEGWPHYIGALPPGPAPNEGDWFTKLRERWGELKPAVPKQTDNALVPSVEPQPLAFKTPGFEEWVKTVSELPPWKQKELVAEKLVELNPGFDGNVEANAEGGVITFLMFHTDHVTDISPVRALPGLQQLHAIGEKLADAGTNPTGTGKLSDLSPLNGLKLTYLEVGRNPRLSDLSPLKDMPLTVFYCEFSNVSDLQPLRGMQIQQAAYGFTRVTDLSPLQGMPITRLLLNNTSVSDLSPLAGMPLNMLWFSHTLVSDLSPLQGMTLESVWCAETRVKDLSPLKGQPLKELRCHVTGVSDLSPLQRMPLQELTVHMTNVADVTPLRDLPLKKLIFSPAKVTGGIEALREINSLQAIGISGEEKLTWTAAEFWKKYDSGEIQKPDASLPNGSPKESSLHQPAQIDEPPPLEEWIKGRTILTVAQDGSGQFQTIQAALDALQAGQAVQVLDKGPYRERLEVKSLPKDTGLVSEVKTILEVPQWKLGWKVQLDDTGKEGDVYLGHWLVHADGFRWHGFEMRYPQAVGAYADGNVHRRIQSSNTKGAFILENCLIHALGDTEGEAIDLGNWGPDDGREITVTVRDCVIHGALSVFTRDKSSHREHGLRATAVFHQNYFIGTNNSDQLSVNGRTIDQVIVRENVFAGPSTYAICFRHSNLAASIELSNNSIMSSHGIHFIGTVPQDAVTLRNNLRLRERFMQLKSVDEPASLAAVPKWEIDHNAYLDVPAVSATKYDLPRRTGDFATIPLMISKVADDINFLRIQPNDPLANAGAGGDWPTYIGALPPGPAPADGDWFTRLRERWGELNPATQVETKD